jgi:hypothetical protein
MRMRLIAGLALLGFSLFAATMAAEELRSPQSHAKSSPVSVPAQDVKVAQKPVQPRCALPTPNTAAGFTKLFASVDPQAWGAADGALSIPLRDGRSVWLYGDTFSYRNGFVHSTAIVQDKGCLHVNNGGKQLVPNVDTTHIFWIDPQYGFEPPARDGELLIVARAVTLTGKCVWCFKDGGYSEYLDLQVDAAGDVHVLGVLKHQKLPVPDPGPMYMYGKHHFGYNRLTHPEFKMASGKHLVTTCQNWDDGVLHPFKDYRPIFTEESK